MRRRWIWPTTLLAGALLLIGAAVAKPPRSPPTPATPTLEQLAEWYIDVGLRNDVAAAKRLNDYLRPTTLRNEDTLDVEVVANAKQVWKQAYEEMADDLLKAMPTVDRKRIKPAIVAAFQHQHEAASRSPCQIVSTSIRADERDEDERVADIRYQCEAPAAPGALDELASAKNNPAGLSTEQALRNFDRFARAFDNDETHTVRGTLTLHSRGERWYSVDFNGVLLVVLDAMNLEPGRRAIHSQ